MAKKAIINRNLKRQKIVMKYHVTRSALLSLLNDISKSYEEKLEARNKLQKLPRNSSSTRVRNRCELTGRARGYYRKFGLGRNKLRELAMSGRIPGITKASW
ncbi:MAG TPA: 30S ribosomal protein S14 [Nitrosomonas nitrosa]|uniref:Small ribosomal subunit protein uS14 n=1 Tax=Nitrosomonas nitrosa TaxID=52442 RepID=A0A1I4QR52_9PROT|nr:30S ribosomal protein S14 [Nitrosomonas nitrosa]PTR03601.1 SSU ribosomal protein S14P [Nitrosomonas nitrosa]CAE6501483.1 30S ribosomal subunit protein S14 [Nitrosomonas nitrosa]SFM42529.1 SSU ribosomal protein S14P [Nitrosomonas nitrosa]HBZ31037.1 30S ribosomal protein S14 [Nitrosomonas nitrosa]HNP51204.1 30S ribosomal protein S14 [Nitrosomonas nitrosa]